MSGFLGHKLGFRSAIASLVFAATLLVASLTGLASLQVSAQVYSKGFEFLEAVDERDGDAVTEMLNEPGTQVVNTRDITSGETGLHIVTRRRDVLWVKFLLQRGADPNIANRNGIYPLQIAANLGDIDSLEALIEGGAQVDVADQQGETPLISAVHKRDSDLIARLLKQGADPDRNDNSGRSARDYAELLVGNTQIMAEFAAADKEREDQGTTRQYGPSF
ncbi:MAG: ankyrin repeat domain-containing protein [Pseudomonadota bacterium]